MKTMFKIRISILILATVALAFEPSSAQRQITSIVTNNSSGTGVSYTGVKGAGIRNASNVLSTNWDSTGSSFRINFSSGSNNIKSVTQISVAGHASPFIQQSTPSVIKIRRLGNSYVNNTGNHYNWWSVYSSVAPNGGTTGTFSLVAPEITVPEAAFLSNNINSGYDNIFQNTVNNLHAGNVERVDFIIPSGAKPKAQYDVDNAGIVVFDRGSGDPFKVALITSLDANNDPLTYGPLVSVNASNFGPDLLASSAGYCILVHDPKYGNVARPGNTQTQNIRGVIMTLTDLGLTAGQMFFGYSLFGPDVATANPNWTTYPNNSDAVSQLDPVNVMGIFRDATVVLPAAMQFDLTKQNDQAMIRFTVPSVTENETVIVERSSNGSQFSEIGRVVVPNTGSYNFKDENPLPGPAWYRLRLQKQNGSYDYSEVKTIVLKEDKAIRLGSNPAHGILTITLSSNWQNQQVNAALYDVSGAAVRNINFGGSAPLKQLPLNNLKPGIYFLQLTNVQTRQTTTKQVTVI